MIIKKVKSKIIRILFCLNLIFNSNFIQIIRCGGCGSKRVIESHKHKPQKSVYTWGVCKDCGREYWSKEKIYHKKPRWFKRKNTGGEMKWLVEKFRKC